MPMYMICSDLEGVLVPEIWIAFAEARGIPALRRTTRDEPDYQKLMRYRLDILKDHGLGIREVQDTIRTIEPLPGARAFLDHIRSFGQLVILSDTFLQFAGPLMEKLAYPTLLCNELCIGEDGTILDFHMRHPASKLAAVRGFQAMGFDVVSVGDSYNDLAMLQASQQGILFRSTPEIISSHPEFFACEDYSILLARIREILA